VVVEVVHNQEVGESPALEVQVEAVLVVCLQQQLLGLQILAVVAVVHTVEIWVLVALVLSLFPTQVLTLLPLLAAD
jgi:hypothetical protein